MTRSEFLRLLAAAGLAGFDLARHAEADEAASASAFYDLPRFGNVSFLHITDTHGQLLPVHYREPSVDLRADTPGDSRWPHRVGEALLREAGIAPGSAAAHAFTSLDFDAAARRYGRLGGYAHIATLVDRLKAERPGALLLDGGDAWQGSATALWTRGDDMLDAQLRLGVDAMTAHWEFTYGADRVRELAARARNGGMAFLAQNIETEDFGDPVFDPFLLREVNGVPCAVIGQAYPYTPIAHPRRFVAGWRFGIQEQRLQGHVDALRKRGAQVVVLLSHNGMDVDLKLASHVRGLDAILGGHTHDAVPAAVPIANAGGTTLVTSAGSHGKFVGVLDFEVKGGRVVGHRYRLLPVFANLLPADAGMAALIEKRRAPYAVRLAEPLASTEGLLYRRGNFNGSWDRLICDASMAVQGAEIAFSPGFRWGASVLAGDAITREDLMAQTAITYPQAFVSELRGEEIKAVLEDVCDNLFHPDPYYRQGGDMLRTGGLSYTCIPGERIGRRIADLRLGGKPLDADRRYKVARWAPIAEDSEPAADGRAANSASSPTPSATSSSASSTTSSAKPIWEVVETWLAAQRGHVARRTVEQPRLVGVDGDPGLEKAT